MADKYKVERFAKHTMFGPQEETVKVTNTKTGRSASVSGVRNGSRDLAQAAIDKLKANE